MLAPIVIFAYNREKHLEKALYALSLNRMAQDTDLFIFIDGPKTVENIQRNEAVKNVAEEIKKSNCFKSVTIEKSDYNRGLASSIIYGVTEVIQKYKKVIVLEDDLIAAPDFLEYMNACLDFYEQEQTVGAISGFSPILDTSLVSGSGIYKARTGNSYGWGTWEERWNKVDWQVKDYDCFIRDKRKQKELNSIQYGISNMLKKQMSGELDSWAVRWDYFCFCHSLWTIYPLKSHICNMGFDGLGTTTNNRFDRRKKIIAQETEFKTVPLEQLNDYTNKTASSYKPTMFEKVYDFCKNHFR